MYEPPIDLISYGHEIPAEDRHEVDHCPDCEKPYQVCACRGTVGVSGAPGPKGPPGKPHLFIARVPADPGQDFRYWAVFEVPYLDHTGYNHQLKAKCNTLPEAVEQLCLGILAFGITHSPAQVIRPGYIPNFLKAVLVWTDTAEIKKALETFIEEKEAAHERQSDQVLGPL